MNTPKAQIDHTGVLGFFVNIGSLVGARFFLGISQIVVLPILARQLSVEDFALMALAMSVVVFSSVLSDAGFGRSLVRTDEFNHVEWSSVFWLMASVGAGLMVATILLAPVAVWFFNEPKLFAMLAVLSSVPFFQAISGAFNAEIERRENYRGIARVQVHTTMISLLLAIALAFAGVGVWALIAQQISLAGLRFWGLIRVSAFRPTLHFSRELLKPHLLFARDTLVTSLLIAIRQQSAIILIGRVMGQIPLGYFSMSQRFTRLPQFGLAGPASSVVYVRMTKARQNPDRLRDIYLASMRLLSTALFVPMFMLGVASVPVFTVFLSEDWAQTGPLFALSIFGLLFEAVALICLYALFRATGRTDLLVKLTFNGLALRLLLIGVSVFHSIEAVAFSITVWGMILVPYGWALAQNIIDLNLKLCWLALYKAVMSSLLGVSFYLSIAYFYELSSVSLTALAVFLGVVGLCINIAFDLQNLKQAVFIFRGDRFDREEDLAR